MHVSEINIKNRVYNCYCDNLVQARKLETEKILIDEKNLKDIVIYYNRYVHSQSTKI